ncbi:MAG: radical SAM protein, partial [Thermoprotei archaeon]
MRGDVQARSLKRYPLGNIVYGDLCEGCRICMHGRKAVIFITGLCPVNCFYCPISAERRGKDLTFVNERQVSSLKELLEEVELMDAEGAGITGGEPLVRLERTINYIRELKKHFGKDFHIHLYTSSQVLSD